MRRLTGTGGVRRETQGVAGHQQPFVSFPLSSLTQPAIISAAYGAGGQPGAEGMGGMPGAGGFGAGAGAHADEPSGAFCSRPVPC